MSTPEGGFSEPQGLSSWALYGPRPVITAAPQRAPRATASSTVSPRARPNVRPAANESPQPYVSTTVPGTGAGRNGPPGWTQPPRAPEVVTTVSGGGSSSPGGENPPSSPPPPTSTSNRAPASR